MRIELFISFGNKSFHLCLPAWQVDCDKEFLFTHSFFQCSGKRKEKKITSILLNRIDKGLTLEERKNREKERKS
jgi:hypothetical protein